MNKKETSPKFNLGNVYTTIGVNEEISEKDIYSALQRHVNGDWGDIPEEDKEVNEDGLKNNGRLLSSYKSSDDVKFWVITEWDRSTTTVLLPSEY